LQLITEQLNAYKTENENLVAKKAKENENLMLQLNEIHPKYKLLQEKFRMKQEVVIQSSQKEAKSTSTESRLFKDLSELQYVYEKEHQEMCNQHQSYIDLKKRFIDQNNNLMINLVI